MKDPWNVEDNMINLIEKRKYSNFKKPYFWEKLKFSISKQKTNINLFIKPFEGVYPRGIFESKNEINNTKFSVFSFIFIFLYMEFSDFSNIYYLFLTITQFFPLLSVGFKISYIFPLALILAFRAFEEIYQHFRIIKRD